MAKFVIECPRCGKYAQASSGLFGFIGGTRTVNCSCGHVIDVKAEKLSSRECPHCGNHVVFDQSKGDKAVCPVCGEPINTMAEQNKTVEFTCGQCGIRLRTSRSAASYRCPICDHENDVAERAKKEEIRRGGQAADITYCGSNDTLIWKHPVEDFCTGTMQTVDESQEAVFFRDGQALDTFPAGRYLLETQRLPMLDKLYQLPVDSGNPFHAKVYFINLVTHMGIKWGMNPKIRIYEPRYNLPVEFGIHGTFNLKVVNGRKLLLKVVGTAGALTRDQLMNEDGRGMFQDMVVSEVRAHIANTICDEGIDLMELDKHTLRLGKLLRERLNPAMEEYGLEITEFYITGVLMPTDRAFLEALELHRTRKLDEIKADVATSKNIGMQSVLQSQHELDRMKAQYQAELDQLKAQNDANVRNIRDKQRIDAEHYEATLQNQREESHYANIMQTRSANIGAYQMQIGADVGIAGANALGQMNANGAGSMGGGSGFQPAAVYTQMAMAQQFTNSLSNAVPGMTPPAQTPVAPPPIPQAQYHVVVNGAASGPYPLGVLAQMVTNGQLDQNTLVWKAGMAAWAAAGTCAELQSFFNANTPPVPPVPPAFV